MADEKSGTSGESHRGGPGCVRVALSGALFAAIFGAGATFAETVIALFNGSYIAWSIILGVFLWWTFAGAIFGLVLGVATLPVAIFLKARARTAVVAGVVLAAGFFAYSMNVRGNLVPGDPLGGAVLLHPVFLAAWGVLLGVVLAVLSVRGEEMSTWRWYITAALAVLFCAGVAHFAWDCASAYMLVFAPLCFLAASGILVERVSRRSIGGLLSGLSIVLCAVGLPVVASLSGGLAPGPIDHGFVADPGKVAMLADRPNVIVITLDTARADHMSLCGYGFSTTPYLEKMASDCRFFPNGVTTDSWTLPAHASLFTGKYPREHGAHSHASRGTLAADRSMLNGIPLASSQLTLAEYLAERGYNTAGFVANYVWLARQFGLQQGFAWYHDQPRYLVFLHSGTPLYNCGLRIVDRLLGRNGKLLQGYWSARTVTQFARSWTARNGATPFFLFLNYMDPHETYAPPPGFDHVHGDKIPYNDTLTRLPRWQEFRDDYIRNGGTLDETFLQQITNQYDGELAYCDHFLGEFIESLKQQGIYDNTLIIITSDHGEFFGEHQLLNHGVGVYEGGLHIPILVKYPGQDHAGEVISKRVSIEDIFATVLDVLQFPLPECSARPLGSATRPILAEDYENNQKVRQYGERFRRNQTVIYSGDWKYIHSSNGADELYNLRSDPRETANLIDLRPDIARGLVAGIVDWQKNTPYFDGTAGTNERMTPEMRRRLRSLGYLGGGRSR